jgi:Tetratricopeptide repeat
VHAKQALEIDARLARVKPERFEPDWAMSLNNYASLLSDLGRSDEAEVQARQALSIYEKLAYAQPAKFEYNFISSALSVAAYSWLADKQSLVTEYPVARYSTPRQQRILNYRKWFLTAFSANEPAGICAAIREAEACWSVMDAVQKRHVEDYGLLLAGLAESCHITSTLTGTWREDLARFRAQRKGWLPWWMQEFAKRAGFSLG